MRRLPLVPALAMALSGMLVVQALATVAARDGSGLAEPAYWLSAGSMVLLVAAAQLSSKPTSRQRLGMAITLGLALYGVKLLANPTGFTYFDELSHARTAIDIANSGHLLHANPLLPISPYFPGLEIVTVSISKLTGLSLFASGLTAIGVGRLILMSALYALFLEASDSPRIAGVATVVYVANPSFLYFDAGFSYESFALPLCVAALVLTLRWMRSRPGARALELLACVAVVVAGLIPTHHLTGYLFVALALALCACALLARRYWGGASRVPWAIAGIAAVLAVIWVAAVATPTYAYLEPILRPAVEGVANVATGNEAAHKAFAAAPTPEAQAPIWLRGMAFASIALILGSLPFGLVLAWRRRANPAALLLGLTACVYVLTLILRVAGSGVESANRSSGFVFLGVGFVIALLMVHVVEHRGLPELRLRRWRLSLALPRRGFAQTAALGAVLATVVVLFIGGVTVFWPPYSRLPGPYLAGTDLRAVSQQGIAAARWMREHLGAGHNVLTDRTNGQVAGAYGEQDPVTGSAAGISIALPFTADELGEDGMKVLRSKKVDYLISDERLADSIPIRGWYFSSSELYATPYKGPIPLHKLTKFGEYDGVNLIYDDGAVRIYEVSELIPQ
jgi:hypothetical protein